MSASESAGTLACSILQKPGKYGDWDRYVLEHPEATLYHLSGWADIIQKTYGHAAYYIAAFEDADPTTFRVLLRTANWSGFCL